MNAYCDRQSVEMNAIAFLFDGRRLRAEQTPDEVFFFLINDFNLIICSIMSFEYIYELKSPVSITTLMLFVIHLHGTQVVHSKLQR